KIVVNKCGGPNPNSFPVVPNLVVFSRENENWFLSRREFKTCKVKLIPNRAMRVATTKFDKYQKDDTTFTIVRICRIGVTYFHSIRNGIELVRELSRRDVKVHFYVIGKVTEVHEYEKLLNLSEGLNVDFITEDSYTEEASKMLYLADAVIGTGRGVMEACSLGIPILIPSRQTNFPVLLTGKNFQNYFNKNFTDRVEVNELEQEIMLKDLIRLFSDSDI